MTSSLVGSEMCIRDSLLLLVVGERLWLSWGVPGLVMHGGAEPFEHFQSCLLYTSDAADDM
eukprot:8568933-Prorocentrum_lima.AAC.1